MAFQSMSTLLKALPRLSPLLLASSSHQGLLPAASIRSLSTSLLTPMMTKQSSQSLPKLSNGMVLWQPSHHQFHLLSKPTTSSIFSNPSFQVKSLEATEAKRTVVKYSMMKGRRKTVKSVVKRFMRLDWGAWIRPKSGRNKHLWKKGKLRRKRIRQHVFTNAWQTRVLDRMTTKYWHKKKYFVDDPYEPYHSRPNFRITKNLKPRDQFMK